MARVLIVEDIKIARKVACFNLQSMGCQIDTACNGHEAFSLFKNNQYDLVLMDLGLPDIDGDKLTKILRRVERTRVRHTPIIALTAHLQNDRKQQCLDAGMDDFILKPITSETCKLILKKYRVVTTLPHKTTKQLSAIHYHHAEIVANSR